MTLEGAIVVVLIACGLLWLVAHIYDGYNADRRNNRWRR